VKVRRSYVSYGLILAVTAIIGAISLADPSRSTPTPKLPKLVEPDKLKSKFSNCIILPACGAAEICALCQPLPAPTARTNPRGACPVTAKVTGKPCGISHEP
jgi:hypothetical protein